MPNLKISQLNAAASADVGDEFPIARAGSNFKLTLQQVADLLLTGVIQVGTAAGGALSGSYPDPDFGAGVAGAGLADTANVLSVNVDGSTIEITADTLNVKSGVFQPLDADLTQIAALTPSNDDFIQRKAGAWTNRTVAQVLSDLASPGTTFQPLDATLTALAGQNWASNAIPIGTGADTVAQTSFGANTFPARSSAGNIAAKTITDFGLSLVDDADAATARTTLDVPSKAEAILDTLIDAKGDIIVGTAADTPAVLTVGANGKIPIADSSAAAGISWVTSVDIQRETRSTNTILGVADKGKTIEISATITQTLEADETLGDGWWVILRNSDNDGTVVVTVDPAGTETIDGLATIKMYSGETRLLMCNGSGNNFNSILLTGGYVKYTADDTFIVPAGITKLTVECIGAGGGGGGGSGRAVSNLRKGGGGGAGGGRNRGEFNGDAAGAAGASVTVDIGDGGTRGSAGSSGDGGQGGT